MKPTTTSRDVSRQRYLAARYPGDLADDLGLTPAAHRRFGRPPLAIAAAVLLGLSLSLGLLRVHTPHADSAPNARVTTTPAPASPLDQRPRSPVAAPSLKLRIMPNAGPALGLNLSHRPVPRDGSGRVRWTAPRLSTWRTPASRSMPYPASSQPLTETAS